MSGSVRGSSVPERWGSKVRQAWRDKHLQDLLYRSEYLATLVSPAASISAPPGEAVRSALGASPVPQLVDATTNLLRSRLAKAGAGALPLHAPPPRGSALTARELRNPSGPSATADPLHGHIAWEEACEGMGAMLNSASAIGAGERPTPRLETLRVQPVPSVPCNAFCEDHKAAADTEWLQHSLYCRHVEQLTQEGPGDTSSQRLRFAQYLSGRLSRAKDQGPAQEARLLRVDRQRDESATRKFSLMEGATALVRHRGENPFHSHALVTTDLPVSVANEGHYFEVRVTTLFRAPVRPERPRQLEADVRTEGLVLGVTATEPAALEASAMAAHRVSRSWCVATSGTFYATCGPATPPPARPRSQERPQLPPSWHQGRAPPASSQLRCPWPPHSSGTVVRKLRWSVTLDEGDSIGMLVTPSGGIVITVNGQKQLLIPDAHVANDTDMYPLVEAYNKVRSVQLSMIPGPPR